MDIPTIQLYSYLTFISTTIQLFGWSTCTTSSNNTTRSLTTLAFTIYRTVLAIYMLIFVVLPEGEVIGFKTNLFINIVGLYLEGVTIHLYIL